MAVVLKSLDFKGVRGFSYNSPSSVQFHTSLTLFTGPNGGGKTVTNLLLNLGSLIRKELKEIVAHNNNLQEFSQL